MTVAPPPVLIPQIADVADAPAVGPFVIFGAGGGGRLLKAAWDRRQAAPILAFIDSHQEEGEIDGVPVVSAKRFLAREIAGLIDVAVLIASQATVGIAADLRAHGFERIIDALPAALAERERGEIQARARPRHMILDIAGYCNARCPFCSRAFMPDERARGYMDDAVLEAAVAEATRWNMETIRLYSTGEPTLHPRFDHIVDMLKERGFTVEASTNCSFLTRRAEALRRLDLLQYSIEGWDAESYERFRYPLRFDRIMAELEAFTRLLDDRPGPRPKRQIHLAVTRDTRIDAFAALWGRFVDEIVVTPISQALSFEGGRFVRRDPGGGLAERLVDFQRTSDPVYCTYPFDYVTVGYDGKIALCCFDFHAALPLGSIFDGVEAVFWSETMRRVRDDFPGRDHPVCGDCPRFFRVSDHDRAWIGAAALAARDCCAATISVGF